MFSEYNYVLSIYYYKWICIGVIISHVSHVYFITSYNDQLTPEAICDMRHLDTSLCMAVCGIWFLWSCLQASSNRQIKRIYTPSFGPSWSLTHSRRWSFAVPVFSFFQTLFIYFSVLACILAHAMMSSVYYMNWICMTRHTFRFRSSEYEYDSVSYM